MYISRFQSKDLLGGLVGGAVILPHSVGLGVMLFMSMGLDASSGALAGLIGIIILQFVTGGMAATTGLLSSPNGPLTMLLVGVMQGLASQGMAGETMVIVLSMILLLMGVFQIIFALLGATALIKYIPYPVVAGLVGGVGILMVLSQWDMLAKEWQDILPSTMKEGFGLLVALLTIGVMYLAPRLSRGRIPRAVAGLFGGLSVYYLLLHFLPVEAKASWVVGVIPAPEGLAFSLFSIDFSKLPISIIVEAALALTMLSMVDSLLTSLAVDVRTGERHDSKKEMMAQGASELLIGAMGAMGGWGNKNATFASIDAGGRRWAPIVAGMLILVLLLFGRQLGAYLPMSMLSGIIAMVGIGMVDPIIFSWLQHRETRKDGMIALLVIIVMLLTDLIVAVAVGVGISILLYLYKDIHRPIVHRFSNAKERHSNCSYPEEAEELIDRYSDEILLCELRGDLFFGTASRLRSELESKLVPGMTYILHLRRVNTIDLSAMVVLLQFADTLRKEGGELVYCHLHEGLGFGHRIKEAFHTANSQYNFDSRVFFGRDSAFEYAEKRLLEMYGYRMTDDRFVPFEESNLCRYLNSEQRQILAGLGEHRHFADGDMIFRKGEQGESIYVVLKGEAELRLSIRDGSNLRIVKYVPGAYLGALGFIHPEERDADAVAVGEVEVLEIRHSDLVRLNESKLTPLLVALLYEFSQEMTDALHFTFAEMRRLEEW